MKAVRFYAGTASDSLRFIGLLQEKFFGACFGARRRGIGRCQVFKCSRFNAEVLTAMMSRGDTQPIHTLLAVTKQSRISSTVKVKPITV